MIKKDSKLRFKPLDNVRNVLFSFLMPLFSTPFIILLIVIIKEPEKGEGVAILVALVMLVLPWLVWLASWLFYPFFYVVDEEYLTKYKKEKVVFRVKIADIQAIFINKVRWTYYFKAFLDCLFFYIIRTPTSISFVFQQCEVLTAYKQKNMEVIRNSLKDEKFKHCFEYVEILSYKKAKKIFFLVN